MSFHGCSPLTREQRGAGQRAEEGGQRRPQSLNTHNLFIQSSHNLGRSEVKKVSHSFYIQTAAHMIQNSKIYSSCGTTGNILLSSKPVSLIKLEIKLDRR